MDVQSLALFHRIVVTLFLFMFLFKTVLLVLKKTELLESINAKTKLLNIILGVLILFTGVYLMMLTKNHSMWINAKALMVLLCIPLGIVAMKKSNIVMALLVNLMLIAAYGIGESRPWNKTQTSEVEIPSDSTAVTTSADTASSIENNAVSDEILRQNQVAISTNAGELYIKFCVNCHGEMGNLGKFNAADLTISTLGMQQRINIITNGKGLMAPYKDDMSAEEIEALAVYLTTLRR